jgi:hypothetical protein
VRGKSGLPGQKVLSPAEVGEICVAIDEAVAALRRIVTIADAAGSGPLDCR